MLLIVLALCAATSVFVAARRRDILSVYLLGLGVSCSLMLLGVIIHIAQMGGVAATEQTFLFLVPEIQRWLQFRPISMSQLGYLVAVGRTLFPWFLLQVGLEVTMIPWVRRRHRLVRRLSAVFPAAFLVYYWPDVFYNLVRGRFWLITAMLPLSMAWILAYLLAALLLMVQEYRATTITFFKRNNGYILLSAVGITALYLLYATKDPAQIYNMFIGEYIRLGITSYIGPSLSVVGWLIFGACTLLFVVLGGYGMVCYAQMDYAEGREDVSLQRKFDAAGTGVSVFVHGIKNQLLSSRVLHKKLSRALEGDQPDLPEAEARRFNDPDGDYLFVRNLYELHRMLYTLYNAMGTNTKTWANGEAVLRSDGTPWVHIHLAMPEGRSVMGFWPWRTERVTDLFESCPAGDYYLDCWDVYRNGVFQRTEYQIF